MEVIEITKSMSKKINLGNYENIDIFSSVKATVGENENLSEAKAKLNKMVLDDLKEQEEVVNEYLKG